MSEPTNTGHIRTNWEQPDGYADTRTPAWTAPGSEAEELEELEELEIRGGPVTLAGAPWVLFGFYLCARGLHLVHLTELVRDIDMSPRCPVHGCMLSRTDDIRWDSSRLRPALERLPAQAPELRESLRADYERFVQRLRDLLAEQLSDEELQTATLSLVRDFGERSAALRRQFLERLLHERVIDAVGISQ